MFPPSAFCARLGPEFNPVVLERLQALDPAGKSGLVLRLFKLFVTVLDEQIGRMETALEQGSFDSVRTTAHSLRSSSLSVGAEAFSLDCQVLERSIAQGGTDPMELTRMTQSLIHAARALRTTLAAALQDPPA